MPGVEETALAFARACEVADVPYAFVGGIAVSAWGQPRATQDVDALLHLDPTRLAAFTAALGAQGLSCTPADFTDALPEGGHVTVHDPRSLFHVDVKLATRREEQQEIAEALPVELPTGVIRVARPEDVVAFKVAFASPLDLQDARVILARQKGALDLARLRRLANRLGVAEEVERLLQE